MQRTLVETSAGAFSALVWDAAPPPAARLHFAHATGMHAGLYARLLQPLADRFRITASDARGHGHSPAGPPAERIAWENSARDLLALIDAIDAENPWLLAGHSFGGTVSLLAAVMRPDRVAGLVLLDPPFIPFAAAHTLGDTPMPNPMADKAARRRADFADVEAARAAWAGRGVFAGWSDADLDAYLADGLRPTDAGVTLTCAPATEAATFRGVTPRFEAALAALDRPFALVAGETGSTVPADEFRIIAAHPCCLSAARLAGTSHFVPLERGDAVRAAIGRVADAAPRVQNRTRVL